MGKSGVSAALTMPKGVHAGCPTVPLFILPWGTLQPVSSRLDSQEGSRYQKLAHA